MKNIVRKVGFFVATASVFMACQPKKDATQEFANLSKDTAFVAEHENPKPIEVVLKGEAVSFDVKGGEQGKAYLVKAAEPTDKYIFVVHEWWGLNNHIKSEADRLSEAFEGKVNVLALDMYDGKLAEKREDAAKLMQGVDKARAEAIVKGALAYAGAKAKIGTIGWCFGGGWSLQSTLLAGKQSSACVMYYGMPEQDLAKLKSLSSDVMFVFASQDDWINKPLVDEFEKNMKTAKKKLEVVTYDAVHAFANPSNPGYDKEKAEDAHAKAVAFLKERMMK
jgi:carboxymethylenebutenolidase